MKKIELGQAIGIFANVGVLVGILLLAYELNQNRDIMQAQTRNALSQNIVEILIELGNDAGIVSRGNRGDDLTEVEYANYQYMVIAQLRYHENVHYQYRNGLYDETEYLAQRRQWRDGVFQNMGVVTVYCRTRQNLSPEFASEIDDLLSTYQCE